MSSLVDQVMSASGFDEKDLVEEEEEEVKKFEKAQFTTNLKLDEGKVSNGARVLILSSGAPQALARIMFEESWSEVGKFEATG